MSEKRPRYFEQPDKKEKPLGFWRMLLIILSTHLGVRKREQREDDFKRANGLYLFIGGLIYFALIIIGLIILIQVFVL